MEFCFLDLLLSLPASAIAGEDARPVFQQLPFPGPYQDGMNLVFTRKLANRLVAFKRFQRHAELVGRLVSPPFLDHRTAHRRSG